MLVSNAPLRTGPRWKSRKGSPSLVLFEVRSSTWILGEHVTFRRRMTLSSRLVLSPSISCESRSALTLKALLRPNVHRSAAAIGHGADVLTLYGSVVRVKIEWAAEELDAFA